MKLNWKENRKIVVNDSLPGTIPVIQRPDPKTLPHYCEPGDCHCSAKLPGRNHPADCLLIHCEHHQDPANVR